MALFFITPKRPNRF